MAIISENIKGVLNYRIEQEEASSRLYKSMSIWLNYNGFLGSAKLWDKYSQEELVHSQWAYNYLLDLNIKPTVPGLSLPQAYFKGLPEIIALSFQHELKITEQCKELVKQAQSEGDFMAMELGLRYCKEQVEELGKFQNLLDQLESFGSDKTALRLLDNFISENLL